MTVTEDTESRSGIAEPGGTVLYESERARVVRWLAAGIIRKEPLGPDAAVRLHHEVAILSRLACTTGVAQLAPAAPDGPGFALIDVGGVSLASKLRDAGRSGRGIRSRSDLVATVAFALSLARVVAAVHREGVLHLDINPANIVVGGPDQQPFLIDWELASTSAEVRPGFTHESTISGTPAYLAPEQTGRTGWGVDHRADLYALGATLYELAVGGPPFADRDGDMLALIHDHLARVPTAPHEANAVVPTLLSDIILRLLEKEPDSRYQSAAGLAHDLARLLAGLTGDDPFQEQAFPLGEQDFPTRICAPSRLIGREDEVRALRTAFDLALTGQARGLLVTGAPGVGKSALVDELRAIVTAAGGWYVQGKFDQYRQDVSADAVTQVMSAVARLMLAEPQDRVDAVRARVAQNVGADAGLVAAVSPEYATLLDVVPASLDGGDAQQLAVRLRQASLGVLRAVVSPERPVVLVIEDLQWAGGYPIEFVDAVLTDPDLPGLLLVGAYRDGEVDGSPFSAMSARWDRIGATPTRLHLANLPPAQVGSLLADMLRLPPGRAADLAAAVNVHTGGNPYDTVELVNALRREGVLRVDDAGWRWDAAEIRSHIGSGDVVQLLAERIGGLPAGTGRLLEVLACLGGEVELALFAAATGLDAADAVDALTPALEDGLLVLIHDGVPAVRFRHDRVQQAALGRLGPGPRRSRHLELARRLTAHPHLEGAAAEQYLDGVADVTDPAERYRVARLFRASATHCRLINQARAERFLAAALTLLRDVRAAGGPDPLVAQLLIDRHAALFHLARLAQADEVYAEIARRAPDPAGLAASAAIQIVSLNHRSRPQDAVTLGTELLAALGFAPPSPDDIAAELDRGLDLLYGWVAEGPRDDELDRPESGDPRVTAAAWVIARTTPAAFYCGHPLMPWLLFTAHRLWVEHGPSRPLASCLGGLSVLGIAIRQDYAVGYRATRRILSVSEAHGYEPETSELRNTIATFGIPWFEPVEESARQARSARECLLRYGELQFAAFTYVNTLWAMLDCAPALDACEAESLAAQAFWTRTGYGSMAASFESYHQLLRCLRGETDVPGGFDDDDFQEAAYLEKMRVDPSAVCNLHWLRALAAAVFGDAEGLASHTAAAIRLVHHLPGMYSSAMIHALRGLAVAAAATAAPDGRPAVAAEFDACRDWLAARADDAPENFAHLVCWLDAERAWALDDFRGAVRHFDAAMARSGSRRPGHSAMITERAARFHLGHGLNRIGRTLLAEARDRYARWGADAKVSELRREFPFLGPPADRATGRPRGSMHSTLVSSDAIDLLAVVRASQTLSSETNLDTLRTRVVEVLTAMTGATSVRLLLWNEDAQGWFLPATESQDGRAAEAALRAEDAGAAGVICLSAFRYAERTREPLVVADATRDDRFSRDPYLTGLSSCSLLVMPIISRGTLRAMLLMENRLSPGIFTRHRLDAVVLIAGQLAVSLDNALAERFRSLVQRSSELTLVCDRDGILTYASAASADILGVQDTCLTGRAVAELVHPEDRGAFAGWLGDGGPQGQMIECRVLPTGPGPRWLEVSCTDLTGDPAVAGMVLHLRDVSERRRLEGELRHAQKLESVGQLAAGVAHEINTPIQFISSNLLFIADSIGAVVPLLEEYRQALDGDAGLPERQALEKRAAEIDLEFLSEELPLAAHQALEGTEQVAKIVRAMKAFAHPGGEQKDFADLNEAIRNTLVMANSEIKFVADVVLDLGALPPVWCNLGDLNQAVLNLIVNAAQAIGEAAGTGRDRGTLTVRTRADDGVIVVEIEDTGNGIPPAIADRVFEQFFTTKAVGVGTGQGLALVYTLIHDRHQGTVTFTSEPGAGTIFTVRLPQPAGHR